MGGGDINYPAQPSYGEGLADAMKAQRELIGGTGDFEGLGLTDENMLALERQAREQYGQMETDLIGQRLLGKIERFDEEGKAQVGTRQIPVDQEALGPYEVRKVEGGRFGLYKDGEFVQGAQSADASNLLQFVEEEYKPAFQQQIVEGTEFTEEPIYEYGEAGDIASRSGGLLDLYGGKTKVRQVDPETGEVTYGTAGFDPESGEFQGLVPMQQQAQAYLASQQRESDIADVEKYSTRATKAAREQGDIEGALEDIKESYQTNVQGVSDLRGQMMGRARSLMGQGLSDRERRNIEQASRQAGAAAGRIRDIGRVAGEAMDIAEADRQRQFQNQAAAQSLLQSEMGTQQALYSQALQRLGAEQSTSVDPFMAILNRPSTNAPAAGGLAQMGMQTQQQSGPQFFNPEAGLGYIQNAATNQANIAAAQAGAQGTMMSGLFGGAGDVVGAALPLLCWVAREVYGSDNPRWLQFRAWMLTDSPKWLLNLYIKYGERFANWISNKPTIKSMIRYWMDTRIA